MAVSGKHKALTRDRNQSPIRQARTYGIFLKEKENSQRYYCAGCFDLHSEKAVPNQAED